MSPPWSRCTHGAGVDKRQLRQPGSQRGQLPLCGGLCYPRTPSACACRSCSALLQALARTGASAGRRTVNGAASQVGSGEADTPSPGQRQRPLLSHLLHNLLNAVSPLSFQASPPDSLFPRHLPPDEPARPACSLFSATFTHG